MAEIKYIPVSKLWRHPDNPRKDLGDVTELAESIKVNGVLQNLTVVPLIGEITKKWDGESYRVIIGHRRLAAAKLAGLEELPCVVVEMSDREQLSTMLTENMQRSDLTVYEQAQGFQMMLDMGDTVEDIAEKSGFSATTVRRRVTPPRAITSKSPAPAVKRSSRLTARSFPVSTRKIRTRPPAPASLPTGGAAGRQAASSRGRNAMDKLTWYDEDGRLYCRRGYEVALARLASYEATELMPDEIVKMGMMFEDSKRYSGRLELKLNAAAKRMPKWVSVKERLPEDRSNVLVVAYWHERWGVYMGWCAPERAEWSVHIGIGDRNDVAVTYWMPLLEPPKEDDRND